MPTPEGIPSLQAFLESVEAAKHTAYVGIPDSRVAHAAAFRQMSDYILRHYDQVEAPHSFEDESGAVFDCVPIEQQPALRDSGEPPLKAPDLPAGEVRPPTTARRKDHLAPPPFGPEKKDRFGNLMHCPAGTVPVRRVTLEDLTRFPSLREFFMKGPRGSERPPRQIEPPTVAPTHRYAHAWQAVDNGGGHSWLGLWNPTIGANQIFSLAQHWYVGGSGAQLQTVECGWQVYPGRLGDTLTHLFTYYTADDYTTTGCYDLSCSAFVQLSSTYAPGMVLKPVSTIGGSQYIMELSFWHTGGAWFLYYNGQSGSNAIGYYPDRLFNGGALTQHATEIDYGGETVGTTSFPPMGSGRFAAEGWKKAAYLHNIGYWTPQGGAMCDANLTPSQSWPSCYTAIVKVEGSPWAETLWYGGPGGN